MPILSWKTTFIQCTPYRTLNKTKKELTRVKPLKYNNKLMQISNEIIISAWNHFHREGDLLVKHVECFDILYQRKIFKHGDEISEKTKKPCSEWYQQMAVASAPYAVAYAIDNNINAHERNSIRNLKHHLNTTFTKLWVLKSYFTRFKNEDQLIQSLEK